MEYCFECGKDVQFKGFNLGKYDKPDSKKKHKAGVYYFCPGCGIWWRIDLGISKSSSFTKIPISLLRKYRETGNK